MARPSISAASVSNQTQQWDGVIEDYLNDLRTILLQEPLPPASFADLTALNAAHDPANYDECLAFANGILYRSDGATWIPYQGVAVADLGSTASAGYVQGEAQAVIDKVDELLGSLRDAGIIAT